MIFILIRLYKRGYNIKMEKKIERKNQISEEYIRKIVESLKNISYGSITLVIQDGIVIQVETKEKIRLK
ncbi:YezD family protein [Clostridium kluyveri]|nr:YezD family protein [Clostridium kluyveri]